MPSDQRIEKWWTDTPSLDDIVTMTKAHVASLETTTEEEAWRPRGFDLLLLRTVGRRTGVEHKVVLPTWRDPDGQAVVVASFAGARAHPAWYLNLSDRVANPEVHCTMHHRAFWSVPDIIERDEHTQIWALLTADRAWYNEYQALTDRQIPLVRLPESRPA